MIRRQLKDDRRGFFQDPLILIVLIATLVLVGVFASKLMSSFNEQIQNDPDAPDIQKEIMQQQTDDYPRSIDGMIMVLFGFGAVALIASLFKVGDNPVLFFVIWFIMLILTAVAAFLANVWDEFVSNPLYAEEASRFAFAPWLMEHLPHTMVVLIIIFFIGLIVKNREGGGF